jgi:hypothetical protein
MSEQPKFLLRKSTGDQTAQNEQEIRDWFQRGQCKPADFLFDFSTNKWSRVGDAPFFADLLGAKPAKAPEKKIVYYMPAGSSPMLQGPFTTKELQGRMQTRDLCESTWIFVEGDKEWRQVKAVKVLFDMLPALPTDVPAPPAAAPEPAAADPSALLGGGGAPASGGDDELVIELGSGTSSRISAPAAPPPEAHIEREEATMALSTLGLSLTVDHSAEPEPGSAPPAAPEPEKQEPSLVLDLEAANEPPPMAKPAAPPSAPPKAPVATGGPPKPPPAAAAPKPPTPAPAAPKPMAPPSPGAPPPMAAKPAAPPPMAAKPAVAPSAPPSAPPKAPPAAAPVKPADADTGSFDGITAQIPTDPIWLVKQATSETVSGPFRFLDVMKFLSEGRLTKNDKISKVGTNRFVKIQQQYEFNVKYTVETVVENGVERQKILIKRRHPRVAYFTEVQVQTKQGMLAANCVNISAGGILMENAKAELNLGDIIEIKLVPGLIDRSIACKSLVIGKIPKMPPAYALKFEDLKQEDKEAIEYYVQETLKRES